MRVWMAANAEAGTDESSAQVAQVWSYSSLLVITRLTEDLQKNNSR